MDCDGQRNQTLSLRVSESPAAITFLVGIQALKTLPHLQLVSLLPHTMKGGSSVSVECMHNPHSASDSYLKRRKEFPLFFFFS